MHVTPAARVDTPRESIARGDASARRRRGKKETGCGLQAHRVVLVSQLILVRGITRSERDAKCVRGRLEQCWKGLQRRLDWQQAPIWRMLGTVPFEILWGKTHVTLVAGARIGARAPTLTSLQAWLESARFAAARCASSSVTLGQTARCDGYSRELVARLCRCVRRGTRLACSQTQRSNDKPRL